MLLVLIYLVWGTATCQIPMVDEPYGVRISATKPDEPGTFSKTGPDHWLTRGFELQETISRLYDIDASRVVLPAALDHKRYDVALTLPKAEPREAMIQRARQAVEKKFALSLEYENRPMDVYVLTVVQGKPAPKAATELAAIAHSSMGSATIAVGNGQPTDKELLGINVSDMTMEEVTHMLETGLDRLVIDETGLTGRYDLKTDPDASSTQEFFRMLQEQCALELKPAQRMVKMLVARSK
jgi:uncharacterized protein (TIGR03435 family)